MSKPIICLVIFIFLIIGGSYAGTTGKMAGAIRDAETGEGLPGVNVIIEGTTLGAGTDADGTYVILNIPPGLYTIVFNYIGYQTIIVRDVRVNIDFTTRLDQNLQQTVLEGETVEVFGERNPLVRQDLTNTQVAVTSETILDLPVDQINQVLALQAGITVDNSGALHIRGGRSNEISYQVNGLSINNPYGNAQGVGLATNAVEEVSVSAGTFSAEYGNALSGVVNYVTKDGGHKYHGSLRAWTGDHLSNNTDVFYNIDENDPFNNHRLEWTLSGPVPLLGNKLTFFTSGVYQNDNGHLYGIRIYNPEDLMLFDGSDISINPFGLSFVPGPDNTMITNIDFSRAGANGDGEIVPMVTRESLNLTGKLTWKPINEIILSYDLIFDDGNRYNRTAQGINAFRRYRFTPDGRPKTTSRNYSHSVGITHTLTQRTFYTLKLGYNQNNALTSVFEDKYDPRYVPSFEDDIQNHILPQTAYTAGGMDLARTEEKSESYLAKIDLVSQILNNHELKFGGEYIYHFMDYETFTYQTEPRFPQQFFRFVIPNPEEDTTLINYQSYDHQPVQFSIYLLDKMELAKQFIFNIGLRYEYFHSRAPYNPDLAGTVDEGVAKSANLKFSEPKHNLMPRLSLSFPITATGIIRFSYGIFYQYPNLRKIYRNPRFVDNAFNPAPNFGYANLEPERSTQYEIGLQQQFTQDLKMDLTVFYKDVTNLIEDREIIAGEVAFSKPFNVYTNISYSKVKGFTASLLKRRSMRSLFSATLDYTFMDGKGAFTDAQKLAINTRTGRSTEQKLVPLDYDRTHVLNGTITIGKTNNWLLSAIGAIRTGTPYTPSLPPQISPISYEVNSARRPYYRNVDLKLEKFFKARAVRFSVFMQINNLFDNMNDVFVHTNTGRSLTNLNSSTNPTRFNNLVETILLTPEDYFPVEFLDIYYQREDWLSEPREVRLGMSFDF
jgi:outer membrane receptor protein involved in Fe transport